MNRQWAVYQLNVDASLQPVNAVCEQGRWEEMDRGRPGRYRLIQGNIPTEQEAEKLARGLTGAAGKRPAFAFAS